ncbi:MAG TPA: putative selenium-dependent hydroxylase accessory protein YqeC [Desulfosporosinus sp.]|nr:putative selenium-dependent hydroxylase accessory protein YqeC [Desulfosporosinus sp.]
MSSSETELRNSWASGSLWGMTGRAQVVTFIGAGGKTTCLRAITHEIDSAGHRVIATTTTKVFPEESMKGWKNPNPPLYEQEGVCFWYGDVMEESGKWIGPPIQAVDAAIASARTVPDFPECKCKNCPPLAHNLYWVIEGDGAKGLKLKCWEPHEPQIPQQTDCVVLVLDGGLWGEVLQAEQVHRPNGCLDLLGHVWNAEKAWRYFLRSPVFAPQYGQMSWVILLNSPGLSADNKEPVCIKDALLALCHRWAEIQPDFDDLTKFRSKHLRIAAGDAKEGILQWFDLW